MKYQLIFFLGAFLTALNSHAQVIDSTDKFKYEFGTVSVSTEQVSESDTIRLADSSDRFSFFITDPELRHCFITAKLIEYKDGKRIRESFPLSKHAIYKNPKFTSFEDSSFVFTLYQKVKNNNQFILGFRTPCALSIEKADMKQSEDTVAMKLFKDYYIGAVDPLLDKVPIGKPFTFLVITLPDKNGSFPFSPFLWEKRKEKFNAHEWNKLYGLGHTFLIELTIEKSSKEAENHILSRN